MSEGSSGISVKLDVLGNIYVLTEVYTDTSLGDYGILKYTNDGTLLWSAVYNSPGNLNDIPIAFDVTSAGEIYATGTSGLNFTNHITTVKYNTTGILQWAKIYNGGGPADGANDIKIDNLDDIIVVGGSALNPNLSHALIIKYAPSGDTLWTRKFTQLSQL